MNPFSIFLLQASISAGGGRGESTQLLTKEEQMRRAETTAFAGAGALSANAG